MSSSRPCSRSSCPSKACIHLRPASVGGHLSDRPLYCASRVPVTFTPNVGLPLERPTLTSPPFVTLRSPSSRLIGVGPYLLVCQPLSILVSIATLHRGRCNGALYVGMFIARLWSSTSMVASVSDFWRCLVSRVILDGHRIFVLT